MLYTAIMALLAAFVAKWSNNLLGQALTERPLVAGLIAGLFLGDVQTGVLVGAALEAVFLGMVDVGGSVTAEPVTATVLAVAFVSTMGMEQGTAVALAVPIGLLGGLVYSVIHLSISSLAAPLIEKAAARDANIIFGASIKEDLEDEIRITVIATGFDDDDAAEEAPQEPETSVHHASPSASAAKVEEAAAETVGEAQPELPADDDIEVPEFLKNAMKAVNNKF